MRQATEAGIEVIQSGRGDGVDGDGGVPYLAFGHDFATESGRSEARDLIAALGADAGVLDLFEHRLAPRM